MTHTKVNGMASSSPEPIDTEGLIEQLASIEHERWADWQKWMHGSFYKVEKGNAIHQALPQLLIERWERQIATPYEKLTEAEKQSDRDQVMRYWPLITRSLEIARLEARIAGINWCRQFNNRDNATAEMARLQAALDKEKGEV